MGHWSHPHGAKKRPTAISTTRSTREPNPTSPRSPSASARARVYETRNDPITAANAAINATSFESCMNDRPIAASIAASPTRSKVESRKAPNTVPFPAARARAPSRMSAIDPTTNRTPPSQKKRYSFRVSKPTRTAPARQSATPTSVSMSGVSFVRATPRIERRRISRAACVYSCLTRSSWLTRGPEGSLTPAPGRRGRPLGTVPASQPGDELPDAAAEEDQACAHREHEARRAVEPEVIARPHHRKADPGRPHEPEEPCDARAAH